MSSCVNAYVYEQPWRTHSTGCTTLSHSTRQRRHSKSFPPPRAWPSARPVCPLLLILSVYTGRGPQDPRDSPSWILIATSGHQSKLDQGPVCCCLLYTSDAADEEDSV